MITYVSYEPCFESGCCCSNLTLPQGWPSRLRLFAVIIRRRPSPPSFPQPCPCSGVERTMPYLSPAENAGAGASISGRLSLLCIFFQVKSPVRQIQQNVISVFWCPTRFHFSLSLFIYFFACCDSERIWVLCYCSDMLYMATSSQVDLLCMRRKK